MILYLIRGLPGVGKSTLARNLLDWKQCFEADMFFVGVIPGTTRIGYQFDASRIKRLTSFANVKQKTLLQPLVETLLLQIRFLNDGR